MDLPPGMDKAQDSDTAPNNAEEHVSVGEVSKGNGTSTDTVSPEENSMPLANVTSSGSLSPLYRPLPLLRISKPNSLCNISSRSPSPGDSSTDTLATPTNKNVMPTNPKKGTELSDEEPEDEDEGTPSLDPEESYLPTRDVKPSSFMEPLIPAKMAPRATPALAHASRIPPKVVHGKPVPNFPKPNYQLSAPKTVANIKSKAKPLITPVFKRPTATASIVPTLRIPAISSIAGTGTDTSKTSIPRFKSTGPATACQSSPRIARSISTPPTVRSKSRLTSAPFSSASSELSSHTSPLRISPRSNSQACRSLSNQASSLPRPPLTSQRTRVFGANKQLMLPIKTPVTGQMSMPNAEVSPKPLKLNRENTVDSVFSTRRTNSKIFPMRKEQSNLIGSMLKQTPNSTKSFRSNASKTILQPKKNLKVPSNLNKEDLPPTILEPNASASAITPILARRSDSTLSGSTSARSLQTEVKQPPIQLVKVTSTSGDHREMSAHDRVIEKNKIIAFHTIEKKLREVQSEFLRKAEMCKQISSEKLTNDYKLVTLVKNNKCEFVVQEKDLQLMPKNLPANTVTYIKERVKNTLDLSFMHLEETLKSVENMRYDDKSFKLEETQEKLKADQRECIKELFEIFDKFQEGVDKPDPEEIVNLKKELSNAKKNVKTLKENLVEIKEKHEKEVKDLEKEMLDKNAEKNSQFHDLNKKLKTVERVCEQQKATLKENESKLKQLGDHTAPVFTGSQPERKTKGKTDDSEIAELLAKNAELLKEISKMNDQKTSLEENLERQQAREEELNKKMRELEQMLESEKQNSNEDHMKLYKMESKFKSAGSDMGEILHLVEVQAKEIDELKLLNTNLNGELKKTTRQVEAMSLECSQLPHLTQKLQEAKEELAALKTSDEDDLSVIVDIPNHKNLPKNIQIELTRLRQTASLKRREIVKLKAQLSKAHFNVQQLEEQVARDQQLLDVRSELITSLQSNDNTQRVQLDELYHQVGDKSMTINEMSYELYVRNEEFRNLFTTLGNKQLDLARQEHMIKLLEESNERSQMLRVKQEEKMGRMEEEISHLKHTVRIYQHHCQNALVVQY